jgi:histidinol-phosphate aminotransferase
MAAQTFMTGGDNIVQPQFGFAAWAIAALAAGGEVKSAPERAYCVDVEALAAAVDARTRLVFIANPANPTGTWLGFGEIERLHAALPRDVLLVLDGAYSECALGLEGFSDGLDWARDKANVMVTRTFSKVHGLAGLRIGWAYAPADIVQAIDRIRLPFSVPRAGEAAAVAALGDDAFVAKSVAHFAAGRTRLARALQTLGIPSLPSAANFVTANFAGTKPGADGVRAALARRGILVRGLSNYGMPDWLRITIGRDKHIDAALALISQALGD